MEHLHHFGLRQDPFQNEPDLRFYFESVSHVPPHRRIDRGLRQNKGLCVLTGESGTGKTLLTRRLLESLEEEIFDAQLMLMMPGATDANSVLTRYARMVGVEDTTVDRPTMLAQLYEQLAIVREEGRHSVLMLDDAHLLEHDALAEIAGLLNLEYEDRRLVSLLLVGLPDLGNTLNQQPSLGQRVEVRTRLEALDLANTSAYVMHRLQCAEGNPETIPPEAMSALHKLGGGRPRLVNTLADNALFEAYLAGRAFLCADDIERAAADLGVTGQCGNGMPETSGAFAQSEVVMDLMEATQTPTMELNDVASSEPITLDTPVVEPPLAAPEHQPVAMSESVFEALAPEPSFEEPAFEIADEPQFDAFVTDPGGSASALDIGDLLDETPSADDTELTKAVSMDSLDGQGADDLDSAVQEMFNESSAGEDPPLFEAHNDGAPDLADAARIAYQDEFSQPDLLAEEPSMGVPPTLEAEPFMSATELEAGDDLDDLFVELIEE
ncbi:MAG: type II secretory pathway predicted ATPase ExeA [Myxococcota bacterium]